VSRALDLAESALEAAEGDGAEAFVHSERSGLARYAASEVHQPTLIEDTFVRLRVVRDGKVGSALSNRIDAEGLVELATRAGVVADSARPDPDFPGFASPADPPSVEGYDEETASLGADDQARLAAAAIAGGDGIGMYGYFTSGVTETAIASTTGVANQQTVTDAVCMCLAAAEEASGFAVKTGWRVSDVDVEHAGREAAEKAARTRGARDLELGHYRAVLEPYAIADLLLWFGFDSLGGLGYVEERSYFCGRIGERAFDPQVSLADDALDPEGLPTAFDFEATPKRRVELIEEGVIRSVVWDRATAARAGDGQVSTGHAPPDSWKYLGPLTCALSMAGGDAESTEELAARVGDGIYVTRLHYLSIVDPREGILTGMTKDGTFRIRDGKVAEPLINLRFTVSLPEVLADLPGLTRERELVNLNDFYGERFSLAALVPGIATARFNITGTGSGPGL
jgi:predicted Zn-dependent protease